MMVFVDTSALFALVNGAEANHPRSSEVWRSLVAGPAMLLTSNYILLETCSLLQNRLGVEAVRAFEEKAVPLMHVEWIDEERHRMAMGMVLTAGRRKLSLVDCVSFQVMRALGVRAVFCFDDHFREQGFEVMP